MDSQKKANDIQTSLHSPKLIEAKEYQISLDQDKFVLKISTYSDQTINFNIMQTNNITFNYYEKTHTYEDIIELLILSKKLYENIDKVLEFFDVAITQKAAIFQKSQSNQQKDQLIIVVNQEINFQKVQSKIELKEKNS